MQKQEEKSYRYYVTDALYCIADGHKAPTVQWRDIVDKKKEPEKSGDEIALEVIKKLGLKV